MRRGAVLLGLLAAGALAAPASAQAAPAAGGGAPASVRVPGVSAAGNAALARLQGKVDPAVPAIAREDAAFRQQMAAALGGPTIDLAKLAAAMQRGQAVAAKERAIGDAHLLEAIRALPAADRLPFVRAILQQQRAQRAPVAQGAR